MTEEGTRTKSIRYEEALRIIDEHGEQQTEVRRTLSRVETEPPYIKLYLDMILSLRQISTSCTGLLAELLRNVSYADCGQFIDIGKKRRKEVCQRLGLPEATYYRQVRELLDSGILGAERDERGRYDMSRLYVNPHIFGKGDWSNIKELRLHVMLNAEQAALTTITSTTKGALLKGDQVFKSAWTWDIDALDTKSQAKLIHDPELTSSERLETRRKRAIKKAVKPKLKAVDQQQLLPTDPEEGERSE